MLASISLSTEASARSLKELLEEEELRATFTSARSLDAIEMCIGIELSEIWPSLPKVLRGENELLIATDTPQTVVFAYRVTEKDGVRRIEVYSPAGWQKRTLAVADACAR